MTSACRSETNLFHHWLGDTNIVATVAGYQTMRTLANGIDIPIFTGDGEKSGDEKGVLFYVVAPTNYAGLYFWMHHDGLIASGRLTSLYKTNTLYFFPFYKFQRDECDNGVLHADNLYDLNRKNKGSPCTLKPLGWRYFTATNEAEIFLSELRKEQDSAEKAVILARERFNRADKPPPPPKRGEPRGLATSEKLRKYPEYYAARSKVENLESQINSRKFEIMDVLQQLEKMRNEAQPSAPSNPHSPSAQGAGGR